MAPMPTTNRQIQSWVLSITGIHTNTRTVRGLHLWYSIQQQTGSVVVDNKHSHKFAPFICLFQMVLSVSRFFDSHGRAAYHCCMKTALFRLCVILSCSSFTAAQSWRGDRARLCFVREEDNGAINVLQSWIRIGGYEVPLRGGQAVCLYISSGATELNVTSTIPYEPRSQNTEACRSKTLKLELTPNEDETLKIDPATNRDGYTCGWRVKQITSQKAARK
jgi:hypothetical protein